LQNLEKEEAKMAGNWDQYEWIVVVGALLAFFTAYGIGANDVANAFATSVGAKALSIQQAIIIAGIFEFLGSVLLGAGVTDTIRKNIADTDAFKEDPEVLMYGMLCVIAATGLWLILASYLELPVSTTHSVIGGIIGMAIAAHGSDAVTWYEFDDSKEALKKFKGVTPVIVSWVVSPVLSGVLAVILYLFVRTFVLRHEDSLNRALIFFPVLVGITIAINTYFIIYKGFKREINGEKLSDILGAGWSTLAAWGLGALVGIVLWFTFIPWLRQKISSTMHQRANAGDSVASAASDVKLNPEGEAKSPPPAVARSGSLRTQGMVNALSRAVDVDVHDVIKTDKRVQEIHEAAESFDPATEEAFKYLQVFTAMMDSFGHGANDVANSIGPFAAIWDIYRNQVVQDDAEVPEWILVLGGFGIVAGLATYGYKIMRAIGVKLVKMSPSRGFAIELGAATVIVIGSRYGIPLSTTHCQVGATVGVGLTEGKKGVNFLLLAKVIAGWIITLVIVGFTAAGFFAQGAFAPSIPNLRYVRRYDEGITEVSQQMIDYLDAEGNKGQRELATSLEERLNSTSDVFTDVSEEQVNILNETWLEIKDNLCT